MKTVVEINVRSEQAKMLLSYIRTLPFAKVREKTKPESELYNSLDRAFADVRLMLDGKKKEKTLDELIDELRNSNN